jgi:hypothetical protein
MSASIPLEDLSTNEFVLSDQRLFVYSLSSSSSRTTDVTLAAGHRFLFNWSMEADASAGIDQIGAWWVASAHHQIMQVRSDEAGSSVLPLKAVTDLDSTQ